MHRAFRKITSTINQQMHLYNFHLKHFKPLRHVSIFSDHHQGVLSFLAEVITYIAILTLYSRSIFYLQICCHNTSPSLRSIRRTPSQLHSLQQTPTQHDMLPQHLVYKNELNREYVITLARNDETP